MNICLLTLESWALLSKNHIEMNTSSAFKSLKSIKVHKLALLLVWLCLLTLESFGLLEWAFY